MIPYNKHLPEPKEIQLLRFIRNYYLVELRLETDPEELRQWANEVDEVLRDAE